MQLVRRVDFRIFLCAAPLLLPAPGQGLSAAGRWPSPSSRPAAAPHAPCACTVAAVRGNGMLRELRSSVHLFNDRTRPPCAPRFCA